MLHRHNQPILVARLAAAATPTHVALPLARRAAHDPHIPGGKAPSRAEASYYLTDSADADQVERMADAGRATAIDDAVRQLRTAAAAVAHEWASTTAEDLGPNETLADRLDALCALHADTDTEDGTAMSEDDQVVKERLKAAVAEYFAGLGIKTDDIAKVFNDADATVAADVQEQLKALLPEGDEDEIRDDQVSFGADLPVDRDEAKKKIEAVMDSLTAGAVMRVRNGHVLKPKKVGLLDSLSPHQKKANAKVKKKLTSSAALVHRLGLKKR